MGLTVILVECDVTSPAGEVTTLRFSDRAVFPMAPGDADRPNAVWDDRLHEPPTIQRTLFSDFEQLEPGYGVGIMVLANADRGLDDYQSHVWGDVRVWRWIYGQAFSTARSLIVGRAAGTPAYDVQAGRPGRVRVTLYDMRQELDRQVQENVYPGTNDGEYILYEGDANLKGQPKPLAYGRLLDAHVPGVLVNAEGGVIQLHEGRIVVAGPGSPNLQFFDRGGDAGLVYGGDTSHLDPSYFDYGLVLSPDYVYQQARKGLVKFNANPVGSIAFGFKGSAPEGVYSETPGPIIAALLARAGVPSGRIGASVVALASTAVIGIYINEPSTVREAVAWAAKAVPAAILPDRQGVWQAIVLAPPAAEADLTLTTADIIAIEADEAIGAGAGEFAVGYDRLWTTYRRDNIQPELLATAEENRLSEPYRWTLVTDADFKERFRSWRRLKIETPLRLEADALDLTDTLKALFGLRPDGRPRRKWRVTVEMTDAVLDQELGSTVALAAPEYGPDDRFLLIGEEPARPRRDQTILTLWG